MKLGLCVWVCALAYVCVQLCKRTASAKVIPLVAWEFGKAPRILCMRWQRSGTKRLWRCRYLCRTPAAKVTALSQITTVDPQPFMMPSVSWLSKEAGIICYPRLEGVWGGTGGMRKEREGGVEVTDHDEGLRNTTERHWDRAPLCCAAALPG